MKNFIFKKLFANQIRSIGLFDFLKFDEIMIVLDLVADPQLVDGHERVCGRLARPVADVDSLGCSIEHLLAPRRRPPPTICS